MENVNEAGTIASGDDWSLLTADAEIDAELKGLGLYTIVAGESAFSPDDQFATLDQARRDALASSLLRREAEEREEIARTEASLKAEMELLAHRYNALLEPRRRRVDALNRTVCAIAEHTMQAGGYPPRKKSRDVGAGTFGYKTASASVELTDEAAYIAWAEQDAPETLRVKITMPLNIAREYLSESELANTKREIIKTDAKKLAAAADDDLTADLPPGFVPTPERTTYYATPLPAAAIHGTTGAGR